MTTEDDVVKKYTKWYSTADKAEMENQIIRNRRERVRLIYSFKDGKKPAPLKTQGPVRKLPLKKSVVVKNFPTENGPRLRFNILESHIAFSEHLVFVRFDELADKVLKKPTEKLKPIDVVKEAKRKKTANMKYASELRKLKKLTLCAKNDALIKKWDEEEIKLAAVRQAQKDKLRLAINKAEADIIEHGGRSTFDETTRYKKERVSSELIFSRHSSELLKTASDRSKLSMGSRNYESVEAKKETSRPPFFARSVKARNVKMQKVAEKVEKRVGPRNSQIREFLDEFEKKRENRTLPPKPFQAVYVRKETAKKGFLSKAEIQKAVILSLGYTHDNRSFAEYDLSHKKNLKSNTRKSVTSSHSLIAEKSQPLSRQASKTIKGQPPPRREGSCTEDPPFQRPLVVEEIETMRAPFDTKKNELLINKMEDFLINNFADMDKIIKPLPKIRFPPLDEAKIIGAIRSKVSQKKTEEKFGRKLKKTYKSFQGDMESIEKMFPSQMDSLYSLESLPDPEGVLDMPKKEIAVHVLKELRQNILEWTEDGMDAVGNTASNMPTEWCDGVRNSLLKITSIESLGLKEDFDISRNIRETLTNLPTTEIRASLATLQPNQIELLQKKMGRSSEEDLAELRKALAIYITKMWPDFLQVRTTKLVQLIEGIRDYIKGMCDNAIHHLLEDIGLETDEAGTVHETSSVDEDDENEAGVEDDDTDSYKSEEIKSGLKSDTHSSAGRKRDTAMALEHLKGLLVRSTDLSEDTTRSLGELTLESLEGLTDEQEEGLNDEDWLYQKEPSPAVLKILRRESRLGGAYDIRGAFGREKKSFQEQMKDILTKIQFVDPLRPIYWKEPPVFKVKRIFRRQVKLWYERNKPKQDVASRFYAVIAIPPPKTCKRRPRYSFTKQKSIMTRDERTTYRKLVELIKASLTKPKTEESETLDRYEQGDSEIEYRAYRACAYHQREPTKNVGAWTGDSNFFKRLLSRKELVKETSPATLALTELHGKVRDLMHGELDELTQAIELGAFEKYIKEKREWGPIPIHGDKIYTDQQLKEIERGDFRPQVVSRKLWAGNTNIKIQTGTKLVRVVKGPWFKDKELIRMSQRAKSRKAVTSTSPGPAQLNLASDPSKTGKYLVFSKSQRSQPKQTTTLAPGLYFKERSKLIDSWRSPKPPFEWSHETRDPVPLVEKKRNYYNLLRSGNLNTLEERGQKQTGKKGPYELFTGERDETTMKGYWQCTCPVFTYSKGQPESTLKELLGRPNAGKWSQEKTPLRKRMASPGPGHYNPYPEKQAQPKPPLAFKSKKRIQLGPGGPGPGRYDPRQTWRINGHTNLFLSKTERFPDDAK